MQSNTWGLASHPALTVATWNLERKKTTTPRGVEALDYVFGLGADVMVLTEARATMDARDGHILPAPLRPRGNGFGDDERKVVMWSRNPWIQPDDFDDFGIDPTRFVTAVTDTPIGLIRVIGVCIPWHMAEVTYPVGIKRKPWELHIAYLEILQQLLAASNEPLVVAGDFNQYVPRIKYSHRAAAAALERAFAPLSVLTQGTIDGCIRPGIDHIATSDHFVPTVVRGWPHNVTGNRLSDHDGALTVLRWAGDQR